MRGWFDAFRTGGGPTLYDSERTAATHDHILLGLYATFAAVFLAFLVIIPGIRRNKIPTFILLTGSMYILASIVICQFSSHWHVSSSAILASYKHSSGLKLPGRIGVNIGLISFNVTLQLTESNSSEQLPLDHRQTSGGLDFNEKYTWDQVDEVDKLHQDSLERGYPSPILTIAEILAMDAGGFSWGRSYRLAGYYCAITLWCALASWVLMNLLFCLVPRYSGYCGLLTGGLCFLCDAIFAQLLPAPPLVIRFEQGLLLFSYGWNFWMILGAGFVCVLFGVGIIIADLFFPQMISDVHASWRHTYSDSQICSPLIYSAGYSTSGAKLSASYISSCQITMDGDIRSPPIRRSTQWTPKDPALNSGSSTSDPTDAGLADDHDMEEIDRATNLPRRTPLPERRSEGSLLSARQTDPVQLPAKSTSLAVIREGLGYVNPIMWDINMQEQIEDRYVVFSTQSSADDSEVTDTDKMGEFTRL